MENKAFELLKNIIKPNDDANLKVDLSKIEKIINDYLPDELSKNAPANFPQLYFQFKYEYSKFRDFILYEHLIGKNVIALGGGFSSGKSSFLNSLMGKPILPSQIDPSTSIPTYIVNNKEEIVYGINTFDSKIYMNMKDVKSISHGFGEVTNEDDEVINKEITLGHVLKSVFIGTTLQQYSNLAFLDTPGYSKPDTETYSAKTDEKIARAQLNSSDYILWFVQADSGIIKEMDLNFINTLNKEIPKLIIVNKADKLQEEEVQKIVKAIKDVLDTKGIHYVDVFAYSRNKKNQFNINEIKEYLSKWNKEHCKSNFAYNFKVLFVKCKEYYEDMINKENKRLNRLNKVLTLSENSDVEEYLLSLVQEIKLNISELKEIKNKLKNIQDKFFTEIKVISDVVGIQMPEPSEIDLIQNNSQDPLKLIKTYKEKHGIKVNNNAEMIITTRIHSVNPIINTKPGGSEYKEILIKSIEEHLLSIGEIRFNNLADRLLGGEY